MIFRITPDYDVTAYQWLTEVLPAFVRADHRCLRMGDWLDLDYRGADAPSCGTVGCLGGWTFQLLRGRAMSNGEVVWGAQAILRLDNNQDHELFFPDRLMNAENQGTPEHAEEAIAHMLAFAEKHADQLKATRIQSVEAIP